MNSFFRKFQPVRLHQSKLLLSVVIAGFLSIDSNSQDAHFTQFISNPLFLNPANTGNFEGDWRIAGNFRNQWNGIGDPFRTTSVSADSKFRLFHQKIGAGIYLMNDESGAGGLAFNGIYGSLGYEKEIKKNIINAGLQFGMVFGSIDSWSVWDPATGSFTGSSNEENLNNKLSYPDLNFGLTWKKSINKFEPLAGVSLAHLNTPKKSFFEGASEKENLKFTIYTVLKTNLSDNFYVSPTLLYAGKAGVSNTMIGTNAGYKLLGNRSRVKQLFIGAYLRNGILSDFDSFSVLAGSTVGRLDIGISYDFNISKFGQTAGNLGAFEISFIYKSISTVFNSYSIPCERY